MIYWPLSTIARSPLMQQHHAYELMGPSQLISANAINAAGRVAGETTPAIPNRLTCIETVNAPCRRIFLDYPTNDEFDRLEPAGVMEDCYGMRYIICDCFH